MSRAQAHVTAGICGFETTVVAEADADQAVTFHLESGCAKIRAMAERIGRLGPVDALAEIDARKPGTLTSTMRGSLIGCCAGCVVPVGIFKAMQVAAGLALPRDLHITLSAGKA